MSTATAITAEATPLDFGDIAAKLTSRIDLNRDKTRYVACLGNHLEPIDGRQLNSVGGWAGGVWVGHSEVEGCPTMKRTHHMVLRGLFTPLETRAISRKADHRESEGHRESYLDGPGIPPFTRGYTVYAGDDLAYLQSDRFRPMGVVEITSLFSVEWDSEVRKALQNFFFPEWQQWQRGVGEIPILLDDWVDLVRKARAKAVYQSHDIIAEELLESARLFRTYALNQIEKNRQAIQSMRASDTGGQYIGWHNKCRMFAEQLGMVLEDEKSLAPANTGNSEGLIAELRADRALRQQEIDQQKEYNRILAAKLLGVTGEEVVTPEVEAVAPPPLPLTEEKEKEMVENSVEFGIAEEPAEEEMTLAPVEEPSELTRGCTELNGKGEPCKGRVKPGEDKCSFHEGKA